MSENEQDEMDTVLDDRREFILMELRRLWVQYRKAQQQIEIIALAIKRNVVSLDEAVGIMWTAGILQQLGPDEAPLEDEPPYDPELREMDWWTTDDWNEATT